MPDQPAPTPPEPTPNLERGALADIALYFTIASNAVPVAKTGFDAGGKVYDLPPAQARVAALGAA